VPLFRTVSGAISSELALPLPFFAFLGYPSTMLRTAYRKQFYPKPMVSMEIRDSVGVPFASLERCGQTVGVTRRL